MKRAINNLSARTANPGRQCVILFARYPEKGKVKTRLVPPLTGREALELYKLMLAGALTTIKRSGKSPVIFCAPGRSVKAFKKLYGRKLDCRAQKGKDIGARMRNAFAGVFASGFSEAVLAGCDIPDLSVKILRVAFRGLKKAGVTVGPAGDGGYYLIGFERGDFLPQLFSGVAWGSPAVLAETLKIIKKHGREAAILAELKDIDTIDDLICFAGRGKQGRNSSRLLKYASRILESKIRTRGRVKDE